MLTIIREKANFWFDFRKTNWETVTHQTLAEILFPYVKYDKSEADTYLNLEPAHIYNFAIGTYGIKRALKYLNHSNYDLRLFDLQILSEKSENYKTVQNSHFRGQPIKIIRFKVPSYHKVRSECLKRFKCHVSIIFHTELYLNRSLRNIYLIKESLFNLVVIVTIISSRQ